MLRLAQWGGITVATVVAIIVVLACNRARRAEMEQVRDNARFKMVRAAEHVEEYLLNIRTILRSVSLHDPQVRRNGPRADYNQTVGRTDGRATRSDERGGQRFYILTFNPGRR